MHDHDVLEQSCCSACGWRAMLIDIAITMIGIVMLTVSDGTTIQVGLSASDA